MGILEDVNVAPSLYRTLGVEWGCGKKAAVFIASNKLEAMQSELHECPKLRVAGHFRFHVRHVDDQKIAVPALPKALHE